ncbi:hypothetical protein SMD20_07270 [Nonomuraea sp. LP-02]|uniref:hypothetical protein n=1 Tax=Nonomuraea sp. LP-02 TaxID=3097960 RepID=UPI002E321294|nr:hypothetical protein [Nonomuraea sp. LP-02]MED7924024.1 hypothetical protein [Nonomuraea sp. LP-02]
MKNKLLAPRTGLIAAFAMAATLVTAGPAGATTATAATVSTTTVSTTTVSATATAAARPRNGAILFDRISGGRGVLKIKNGLRTDGVVILVKGKTKAISIYVRAKSTASIKDVRDGTYRLYFTTGYAYSTSRHRFTRAATYQRFNDRLRYYTTATASRIYTLTLHPVRGGNAGTRHVNPKDFPA